MAMHEMVGCLWRLSVNDQMMTRTADKGHATHIPSVQRPHSALTALLLQGGPETRCTEVVEMCRGPWGSCYLSLEMDLQARFRLKARG